MGFNKFAWVDAVAGDGRLTEGERFVLTMTAIRYVTYGEDVFHVRQTTIADRFATSERTVRRAQKQGRDFGWLVLVQLRRRGRGHHGANHHRLVIPANLAPITEEISDTDDLNTGQEWQKYRPESTEIPDTADSSTSGNDTPKGSLEGSLTGSLTGPTDDPLGAQSATPGAALVKQLIPPEHPDTIKAKLRVQASELINTGTPPDVVADALRLWANKSGVGPGILPSLVSDVIKSRNGQSARPSTADQRVAQAERLREQFAKTAPEVQP